MLGGFSIWYTSCMALRPKPFGELAAQVFDTNISVPKESEQGAYQKRLLEEAKAALTKAFLEGNEERQRRVVDAFEGEGTHFGLREGYLNDLRYDRKQYDATFRRPFNELIKA